MDATAAGLKRIYLTGEITSESADEFLSQLLADDDHKLVVIDSGGGDLFAGIRIIEAIGSCGFPVDTLAAGRCASTAFLVFLAGRKRIAYEFAMLMSHRASISLDTDVTLSQITDTVRGFGYADAIVQNAYCKLLNKPSRWVNTHLLTPRDVHLTAGQAVALGVADEVSAHKCCRNVRSRHRRRPY